MYFETTKFVDGSVLVRGQDSTGTEGRTVLNSPAWNKYKEILKFDAATAEFDAKVAEFFAPITEAAKAVETAVAENPWATVTIGENVEGEAAVTIELDAAGQILRILEETDGSSLLWVPDGNGGTTLKITAAE